MDVSAKLTLNEKTQLTYKILHCATLQGFFGTKLIAPKRLYLVNNSLLSCNEPSIGVSIFLRDTTHTCSFCTGSLHMNAMEQASTAQTLVANLTVLLIRTTYLLALDRFGPVMVSICLDDLRVTSCKPPAPLTPASYSTLDDHKVIKGNETVAHHSARLAMLFKCYRSGLNVFSNACL